VLIEFGHFAEVDSKTFLGSQVFGVDLGETGSLGFEGGDELVVGDCAISIGVGHAERVAVGLHEISFPVLGLLLDVGGLLAEVLFLLGLDVLLDSEVDFGLLDFAVAVLVEHGHDLVGGLVSRGGGRGCGLSGSRSSAVLSCGWAFDAVVLAELWALGGGLVVVVFVALLFAVVVGRGVEISFGAVWGAFCEFASLLSLGEGFDSGGTGSEN